MRLIKANFWRNWFKIGNYKLFGYLGIIESKISYLRIENICSFFFIIFKIISQDVNQEKSSF